MSAELSSRDTAILNCVFNPHLPLEEAALQPNEELHDVEEPTPELEKSKQLEIEAIKEAEKGNLERAMEIINKAIELTPEKPSLYNNRAHINQFSRRFQDALKDVNTAIDLSTHVHKKTVCQAHCQRGVLYRKLDKIDDARADFEIAAKMGNRFAKGQLVELNPYAALCNQMLRQVMHTFNYE